LGAWYASGDGLRPAARGRPLDVPVFKRHLEPGYLGV